MIIEIAGRIMLGASLEDAARILKHSGNIVRYSTRYVYNGSSFQGWQLCILMLLFLGTLRCLKLFPLIIKVPL